MTSNNSKYSEGVREQTATCRKKTIFRQVKNHFYTVAGNAAFDHQITINGQANNRKYVSACQHFELVYTKENYLVDANFSNVNMGMYNYYGPDQAELHYQYDVLPYEKWRNTREQCQAEKIIYYIR